ncbi:MAG: hypothetical protein GY882_10200 [Actinomycetia bacterium]|nr:hypothetical protein [Actinomycetes bacterium]
MRRRSPAEALPTTPRSSKLAHNLATADRRGAVHAIYHQLVAVCDFSDLTGTAQARQAAVYQARLTSLEARAARWAALTGPSGRLAGATATRIFWTAKTGAIVEWSVDGSSSKASLASLVG